MVNNNPNPVSRELAEAQNFSEEMKKLADQGGYIKSTVVGNVTTYVHSTSKSGKMTAKEIVATATRITRFAGENIAQNELSGVELKNIEEGMKELKSRIKTHHKSQGWIKKIFVGDRYSRLAAVVQQTLMQVNYKEKLEESIRSLPAPSLGREENRSIAGAYLRNRTGNSLKDMKNLKLIRKFRSDNEKLMNKFRAFDDDVRGIAALISQNEHLEEAKNSEPDGALLNAFKKTVKDKLTEKCVGKNLSDVVNDDEFRNLISKYKKSFPADCEGKSDTTLVREITELTTFQFDFARRKTDIRASQDRGHLERLTDAIATSCKGIVRGGYKLLKKMGHGFMSLIPSGKKSSRAESSRGTQPEQEIPTAESRLPEATMRLQSLVIDPETEIGGPDDPTRVYNEERNKQFAIIVNRCGISFQDGDTRTTTHQATKKYLQKSMWGFFVGQKKSESEQVSAAAEVSPEDKMKLEGENTIAHMFYMYNMLEEKELSEGIKDPNIAKLKEDLERSLYFAFESTVVGRNGVREDRVSQNIYQELSKMKTGERLFLPIGCAGHATLLMMTKQANGNVEIQHFNTGLGLQEHQKLAGDKTFSFRDLFRSRKNLGYPIAVSLEVNLNAGSQKTVEEALAYFINIAHFEETTMEDVTTGLQKLKERAGEGEMKVSVWRKKPQQTGNCSYRCLLEGMRNALGEKSYRDFKISLSHQLETDYKKTGAEDEQSWTAELSEVRERTEGKKAAVARKEEEEAAARATAVSNKRGKKSAKPPQPVEPVVSDKSPDKNKSIGTRVKNTLLRKKTRT